MTLWSLIGVCVAAFVVLVWICRRDQASLGMPIAYLFGLLIIHVPGAIAHVTGMGFFSDTGLTEQGMVLTTIGVLCFVLGVWIARRQVPAESTRARAADPKFWLFCLVGGWIFTFSLGFLREIPTLGAAISKSGAIWMLGVMLGLRYAIRRKDARQSIFWMATLALFPALTLILWGFLSYGSAATMIVLAALVISTRSHWRVGVGLIVAAVIGFNAFLSYFANRDDIRDAVWGGATFEERIDASLGIVRDFDWFDPTNDAHLIALDQRLNQNYFVGLTAARIDAGEVDFVYGRSIEEGLISLVPRIIWPDKPVAAGSGNLVAEMTGLMLSDTTSFGVGNVMEFYMNFAVPGVIGGFLILGWLLAWLDRKAALEEARGNNGRILIYFLPAVALIQPNGSMVELVGGSAVALLAAYGWKWVWMHISPMQSRANLPHPAAVRKNW